VERRRPNFPIVGSRSLSSIGKGFGKRKASARLLRRRRGGRKGGGFRRFSYEEEAGARYVPQPPCARDLSELRPRLGGLGVASVSRSNRASNGKGSRRRVQARGFRGARAGKSPSGWAPEISGWTWRVSAGADGEQAAVDGGDGCGDPLILLRRPPPSPLRADQGDSGGATPARGGRRAMAPPRSKMVQEPKRPRQHNLIQNGKEVSSL
jgi:hypothetical protein